MCWDGEGGGIVVAGDAGKLPLPLQLRKVSCGNLLTLGFLSHILIVD